MKERTLSNLELGEFFNQMSLMLCSGISSTEGITLLLEDAKSEAEKTLLEAMLRVLEETGYFYEAAKESGVFPFYALQMLKIGETTGTLDQVMKGLAEHYIREENLANMIKGSLLYPSLMLGMMFLVILVLLTKVMPIFNQVFRQLGQEMTGFSAGLLAAGEALSRYSVLCLIFVIVLALFVIIFRKRLPFQKKLQGSIAVSRFMNGMAIALKSGMTAEESLELSYHLVEQEAFRAKFDACKEKLEQGSNLSEALRQSHILTGAYARLAYIAEKSGTLDEAFFQIATEYEHEVDTKLTSFVAVLEPTLVIVLSLIVGVVLFSVMFPLLGIMSQL